ncbi:MAG: hypothetical protein ABIY56_09390 [Dokdonella sp.]
MITQLRQNVLMEKPASYRTHPDVIPFPAKRATMTGGETTPYLLSGTSTPSPATESVVQLAAHRRPLTGDMTSDADDGHCDRS